ncbi:MAG: hypothetical protein AAGB22_01210 [Bacteroidota bacterium]
MKFWNYVVLVVSLPLLMVACGDDDSDEVMAGPGGNAVISGNVQHHEVNIPNANVFIKYDATEFPGTDVSVYDDSQVSGSVDGSYQFSGLQVGNYYLFSVGYDSAVSDQVLGGLPVVISEDTQTRSIDIPVTE